MFRSLFKQKHGESEEKKASTSNVSKPVKEINRTKTRRSSQKMSIEELVANADQFSRASVMSTLAKQDEDLPNMEDIHPVYFEDASEYGRASIRHCIENLGSEEMDVVKEFSLHLSEEDAHSDSGSTNRSQVEDDIRLVEDANAVIVKEIDYIAHCISAVEQKLTADILADSEKYEQGMNQIKSTEVDIAWALSFSKDARKNVSVVRQKLQASFDILHLYSRLYKLNSVFRVAQGLKIMISEESKMSYAISTKDFSSAVKSVELFQSTLSSLGSNAKNLKCVSASIEKVEDFSNTVHLRLLEQLTGFCETVSEEGIEAVFSAFSCLQNFSVFEDFDSEFRSSFFTKIEDLFVQGFLDRRPIDPESVDLGYDGDFAKICSKIDPFEFIVIFVNMLRISCRFLYGYHKITEIVSRERDTENHFEIITTAVLSNRASIWDKIQTLLGVMLSSIDMGKLTSSNTDDVLLIFDFGHKLDRLGQQFDEEKSQSGSTRVSHGTLSRRSRLKDCLDTKCDEYLMHFHQDSFEFLKPSFRNDSWSCLPLGKDFRITSIKEFQFSSIQKQDSENVYSQFLLGESIFTKSTKENDVDFTEDEEMFQSLSPSGGRIPPILTSSSMSLIRFIGTYCTTIRTTSSLVSFTALLELFEFYLYSVFTSFGFHTHSFFKENSSVQHKYPVLHHWVNEIREKVLSGEFGRGSFEIEATVEDDSSLINPLRVPKQAAPPQLVPLRDSFQSFISKETSLFGVLERCAAVESLRFVAQVYRWIPRFISERIDEANRVKLDTFINDCRLVSEEFSVYMYRNLCTKVIPVNNITDKKIPSMNWNLAELSTNCNEYVFEFVSLFESFQSKLKVLLSHSSLPPPVLENVWKETLTYCFERLVDGYSACRKCSTEGRAQMSLDFRSIVSHLQEICPIKPIPGVEYVDQYIKAFYYPPADLIKWIKEHPMYKTAHCLALVSFGSASSDLSRKEKDQLMRQVEEICENHQTARRSVV